MLTVDHISMEFSSRPVLDDITFLINRKERIALVGKNGAGKTTLLRLIAGEYQPTAGRISKEADMTIGYLPQVMLFQDDRTLREEVMTAFHGEDEARFIAEMDRTIIGLGFERRDFDRPCSEFSGGWRMRIELAKTSPPTTSISSLSNGWRTSSNPVHRRCSWSATIERLSIMCVVER